VIDRVGTLLARKIFTVVNAHNSSLYSIECSFLPRLMFPNLLAPSVHRQWLSLRAKQERVLKTYSLLGKKRPSSGNFVLYSFFALYEKAAAVIPKTTSPMTIVFAFQFAGCAYQPPAGDQTCLG